MTARPIRPNELLTLAERLAGRGSGPGRPRTIELRRAVSTAYYALYRGWCWTVATELLGDPQHQAVAEVCRWINHTDVRDLMSAPLIVGGVISRNQAAAAAKHVVPVLPDPIQEDLVTFARSFLFLQEERHAADYDDRYDVSRDAAALCVDTAASALSGLWRLQRDRDEGTICLLRLGAGGIKIARTR